MQGQLGAQKAAAMAAPEDSEWSDAQRLHNGQPSFAQERAGAAQAEEGEMQQLLQVRAPNFITVFL